MARRLTKSFITKLQAEGNLVERNMERKEILDQVRSLAAGMPTDPAQRAMYIRNITTKALRGEISRQVLEEFIRSTNSWDAFFASVDRAKLIVNSKRR